MSDYPDYNNKEHRDCVRRNLSNCGSGVIDEACEMIDFLESQLAAARKRADYNQKCYDFAKAQWDRSVQSENDAIKQFKEEIKQLRERAVRAESELRACQSDAKASMRQINFDGQTVFGTYWTDETE